jgi:hypothetical protein
MSNVPEQSNNPIPEELKPVSLFKCEATVDGKTFEQWFDVTMQFSIIEVIVSQSRIFDHICQDCVQPSKKVEFRGTVEGFVELVQQELADGFIKFFQTKMEKKVADVEQKIVTLHPLICHAFYDSWHAHVYVLHSLS